MPAPRKAKKPVTGFTDDEKAAMREAARERRSRPRGKGGDPEQDVLAKIAAMDPGDRFMAERIHALVRTHAPTLTPRTWYGMPAYSNEEGDVVCFFQDARKFKTRYATLGFSDAAKLDDGPMWPTGFALAKLTPAEEARILALLKRAVGGVGPAR